MEDKFTYKLSSLLEYSKDGQFVETGEITFDPPSMESNDEATEFEQIVMGAIMSAGKNAKKDDLEESEEEVEEDGKKRTPTPMEVRVLLFSGQDVKVTSIIKSFKKLAVKTGKLDSEVRLKHTHFDIMDRKDFMGLMSGYISFFTFPSLLRGE